MTHAEKVLALLSDGEVHSHHELYALHVMGHSRVADLRKKGYAIECWREGDLYLYQLGSLEGEAVARPLASRETASPSSERERVQASVDSSEHDGAGVRSPHEQLTLEAA